MRTEGPEPILPARDLARTRAFYERTDHLEPERNRGMREFTLKDPSGNLVRVGHELGDA